MGGPATRPTGARGSSHDPGATPSPDSARYASAVIAIATCTAFGLSAGSTLFTVGAPLWSWQIKTYAVLLLAVPAIELTRAVARRTLNLPLSIYWAWSFVFMGLAPAYQLSSLAFPWDGAFSVATIQSTQALVLTGHACVIAATVLVSRRLPAGPRRPQDARRRLELTRADIIGRTLTRLAYGYAVTAACFIALMGPSLYQARAQFRIQLLHVAELPLGGTLFFLVSAGAIAVPAAAIAARRLGAPVTRMAVFASTATAAVATNPLLGSRFLTGSFLVAVAAAWIGPRTGARFLAPVSIALLVAIFPSLDTLRGDGTGSDRVEVALPAESLTDYDFDAFEMLAREASLTRPDRALLPDSVDLAAAPVLRWVPILSRPYIGLAGGSIVAESTGMQFTNVSMPLWGEGHLIAGVKGTILVMLALGAWLGLSGRSSHQDLIPSRDIPTAVTAPASAALMFIVLRGSIYEVFGYLALVVLLYLSVRRAANRDFPAKEMS